MNIIPHIFMTERRTKQLFKNADQLQALISQTIAGFLISNITKDENYNRKSKIKSELT